LTELGSATVAGSTSASRSLALIVTLALASVLVATESTLVPATIAGVFQGAYRENRLSCGSALRFSDVSKSTGVVCPAICALKPNPAGTVTAVAPLNSNAAADSPPIPGAGRYPSKRTSAVTLSGHVAVPSQASLA
jgi:hypothetical protein